MNTFLKRTADTEQPIVPNTSNVGNKKLVKRKYREDYVKYGFSCCANGDAPKPVWVIWAEQLANEALFPSKLVRHLNTKLAVYARNNINHFQRLLSQNKKQECSVKSSFTVSEKALEASYRVAKLIARRS
uniref:protein FAM200B-like n=1 Tax=Styela clava TaxID=7725 RepID=UPI00193997A2|nr:protein FAM200B-like [Styela clava]